MILFSKWFIIFVLVVPLIFLSALAQTETPSAPAVTASPETSSAEPQAPASTASGESAVKATIGEEPKLPPKPGQTQTSPPEESPSSDKPVSDKSAFQGFTSEERTLIPPQPLPETSQPLSSLPKSASSLLDTRISLDLRDIDIMDALKFLAIKANLNVVAGTGITGSVFFLLNDVSIRDAIDIILSANRLAYTIKGNVMRVMTEEEYKALFGKEFYDQRETKIIRLKYASPKNVGAMLENVKSTVGRIIYNDSTGTVVMMDTPEKIAEMDEIIQKEELPTIVRLAPTISEIFDLKYAQAQKVSEKLTPSLTKEVGKIFVDERSNRLIISDLPHNIEDLRMLINALDTKTREVFIEAKIIQINLNKGFQSGIDWAKIGVFQQTLPLSLSSYGQMTVGSIAPHTSTDVSGVTSTTYSGSGAIFKLLENFGSARILSTPQIATVDGEEAKIMVGSKEAYTTSSVTQSQATTTTAQQVTFVDVGITLRVTPTINADGMITMKIKPEVSSVTRFLKTSQGDQIPIVESTNAETKVMIKDGSTILIGGLMSSRKIKSRSGLPLISRIPVLGLLFRSTDDATSNSELIILLTPHIMNGEENFQGTRPSSTAQVTLPADGQIAENSADGKETKKKTKRRYYKERK
jgi:type IV pilus assembly protein PilQ